MGNKKHSKRNENVKGENPTIHNSLCGYKDKSTNRKDDVNEIGVGVLEKTMIDLMDEANDKESLKIDQLKNLEEDRGKTYGDPFLSHQAIGLVWEGIFRNRYHCFSSYSEHMTTIGGVNPEQNKYYSPSMMSGQLFPADLVAEMLAGFKLARLARPIFLQDSADDAKVYISFSERFRK